MAQVLLGLWTWAGMGYGLWLGLGLEYGRHYIIPYHDHSGCILFPFSLMFLYRSFISLLFPDLVVVVMGLRQDCQRDLERT